MDGPLRPPEMQATVVVVTHNSADSIQECLDSILHQGLAPKEMIVVDNASTDGTLEVLRREFSAVNVQALSTNRGFAAAVNHAANLATGEILAVLNPDAVADREWLAGLVSVIQERPDAGAVTSAVLVYGTDRVNAMGMDVHVSGLGTNRFFGQPANRMAQEVQSVPAMHGSAFACRLDRFHLVGGMNEAFFLYVEDVELSMRLRLTGFAIYLNPASIAYHRYYPEVSPEKYFLLERNRWLGLMSTFGSATITLLFPLLLASELGSTGYAVVRGKPYIRSKIRAWSSLVRLMESARQRRLQLMNHRRTSEIRVALTLGRFLSLTILRDALLRSPSRNPSLDGAFPR